MRVDTLSCGAKSIVYEGGCVDDDSLLSLRTIGIHGRKNSRPERQQRCCSDDDYTSVVQERQEPEAMTGNNARTSPFSLQDERELSLQASSSSTVRGPANTALIGTTLIHACVLQGQTQEAKATNQVNNFFILIR
jgi:hypothetical protein